MIVQAARLFAAKFSLKHARMDCIRESAVRSVQMDVGAENLVTPFADVILIDLNPLILNLAEPVVVLLEDHQCLRQVPDCRSR